MGKSERWREFKDEGRTVKAQTERASRIHNLQFGLFVTVDGI